MVRGGDYALGRKEGVIENRAAGGNHGRKYRKYSVHAFHVPDSSFGRLQASKHTDGAVAAAAGLMRSADRRLIKRLCWQRRSHGRASRDGSVLSSSARRVDAIPLHRLRSASAITPSCCSHRSFEHVACSMWHVTGGSARLDALHARCGGRAHADCRRCLLLLATGASRPGCSSSTSGSRGAK